MKILNILIIILLFGISCLNSSKDEDITEVSNENGYKVIKNDNISFSYKIEENSINAKIKAYTNGWISAGFNNEPVMDNANIIIGYVKNSELFISDEYGSGHIHNTDSSQNISTSSGTETSEYTEIEFSIPLDSGDSKDIKLEKNNTYKLLLAYGESDDFTSIHTNRYVYDITID